MKYSQTHEWIKIEGESGTVGVTDYAQKELGDIVYVELPEVGKEVTANKEAVVLESTKAAADVYSPVTGVVTEINNSLQENSETVNLSPEEAGWLFKVRLSRPDELEGLMDKTAYEATLK